MRNVSQVMSTNEMKQSYGRFYEQSSGAPLNPAKVPNKYWPLLPYAEFWGIADDWTRETLVKAAPRDVQMNLKEVVGRFDSELDEWLAGPEAGGPNYSKEYIAFSAMRRAADCV